MNLWLILSPPPKPSRLISGRGNSFHPNHGPRATGNERWCDATAIGLAANLPQTSFRNTYQLQNKPSYTVGNHTSKIGVNIHRQQLHQLFKPTARGHLVYTDLNDFVADIANVQINRDLQGVARVLHLDWHDFYFYGQDEWRVKPNLTLTLEMRYENAGQPIGDLVQFNDPVFAASGSDPRFRVRPIPGRDTNNWQPRFGFNWNLRTKTTESSASSPVVTSWSCVVATQERMITPTRISH